MIEIQPCPNIRHFIHPKTRKPATARCMRLACPACREIKRRRYLEMIADALSSFETVHFCSISIKRWPVLGSRLRSQKTSYIRVRSQFGKRLYVASNLPFYGILLDNKYEVEPDVAITFLTKIVSDAPDVFEKMITTSRDLSQKRWQAWREGLRTVRR